MHDALLELVAEEREISVDQAFDLLWSKPEPLFDAMTLIKRDIEERMRHNFDAIVDDKWKVATKRKIRPDKYGD